MMHNRRSFNALLQSRLTPKRYRHSLLVELGSIHLAIVHGEDPYLAGVAGLMHDVCHCDPPEWQLRYLRACGVSLGEAWMAHPAIWHALTGSLFLHRELHVREKEILRAVRYHTTGCAGMTRLDKVVYLADKTSPDRSYPGVERLRELCKKDLDAALRICIRHQAERQIGREQALVKDCWEAYNEYVARPKKGREG